MSSSNRSRTSSATPSSSSVVRRVPTSPSNVTAVVIKNDLTQCRQLLELLKSCYGPRGKKQSIGGPASSSGDAAAFSAESPVRVSSSIVSRLMSQLRIKHPFNSIVFGGVKSHLEKYADGGCMLAMLTLQLTLLWLEMEQPSAPAAGNAATSAADRKSMTALAPTILELISDELLCFGYGSMSNTVDLTSVKDMEMIVRPVLTSNAIFFNATDDQIDYITAQIVEIFLSGLQGGDTTSPSAAPASFRMPLVEYRHVYGLHFEQSTLKQGVIIPAPSDWRGT